MLQVQSVINGDIMYAMKGRKEFIEEEHDRQAINAIARMLQKEGSVQTTVHRIEDAEDADEFGIPYRGPEEYRRTTVVVGDPDEITSLHEATMKARREGFQAALRAMKEQWANRDGLMFIRDKFNKNPDFTVESYLEQEG